jgi:mRNA-degrading endonuclease toxin of MazEF toxin-antitoxin module
VLLSRDAAYRVRAAITVAPITRTIRNIPVEVALDRSDGMPVRCVVNLDDITTLPKVLIKQRITALSTQKSTRSMTLSDLRSISTSTAIATKRRSQPVTKLHRYSAISS